MKRLPLLRFLARFARARDAATAVEFAIVSMPFFAILCAMLQIGAVFFAQQVLQTAVTQSARLIMTGQAQSSGMTATQFQQSVCANAQSMFTCSGIGVNVQTFSNFSSVTFVTPLTNNKYDSTKLNYTVGGIGDIMLVQAFYQWPVFIGPFGFTMSNMSGNNRLLQATAVFRNEPY
jgi:Flp pilus assembly protein TadG